MRLVRNLMLGSAAALALGAGAAEARRGQDGQLNILYWQAVSILNPFLSGGTKDVEGASLVLEPLARYDQDGNMVPWLAEDIPTVENGGVSADLKTITWKLKPGLKWSDGSDVTADDVVFTWAYCTAEGGGCQQATAFENVANVEALDALTVRVTFDIAKPFPYGPFVGATSPIIQKAQFKDCLGPAAPQCTQANFYPIGTGPFVVKDFKANDVVVYEANPHYRDPDKPAFQTVVLKGGGDAAAAARSVMETGEFDYAWNMQVQPEILAAMEAKGIGKVVSAFGTSVERLMVNFTNPDPALGEKRSTREGGPHPFLTDRRVTRALSLAIDRQVLVDVGYGPAGQVTCNVLPAPAIYNSTNNDWCKKGGTPEAVAEAKRLLEEAGFKPGPDGVRVRESDGRRLSILYQTSTNAVRQETQALIKQMWAEIGVETELRNISASVFFGGDPSSPDTFQKFYADIEMYTNNFDGTDPQNYMGNWLCKEAPSPENNWLGNNMPRYCDPEYDALFLKLSQTAGLEARAEIAKKLNDMLIEAGAIIPLIHRGRVSAKKNDLGGHIMNPWDSELWNIADWYRIK
ncbi:MAG: peptide ABC transporter substrate-binding protein [Alphaproteobacteria bacterium]|nr:MAG: peptide ABC transporter substrate-binding protein [Alphaproteobacteria bacterium]